MKVEHSAHRRIALLWGAGSALPAWAQTPASANSVASSGLTLEQAISQYTGGVQPQHGKVRMAISPLVDNGNAVPIDVKVDHPQQAGNYVSLIALLNERNPQREVAEFELFPESGIAQVSARIRLATTQNIAALARLSDGSWWMDSAEVIVTLAACVEVE